MNDRFKFRVWDKENDRRWRLFFVNEWGLILYYVLKTILNKKEV